MQVVGFLSGNEYRIQCEGRHCNYFIAGLCHTFLKWLDQEDLEVFLWAKEKKDLMVLTAIVVTTTIRKNIIKRRTSELNISCLFTCVRIGIDKSVLSNYNTNLSIIA